MAVMGMTRQAGDLQAMAKWKLKRRTGGERRKVSGGIWAVLETNTSSGVKAGHATRCNHQVSSRDTSLFRSEKCPEWTGSLPFVDRSGCWYSIYHAAGTRPLKAKHVVINSITVHYWRGCERKKEVTCAVKTFLGSYHHRLTQQDRNPSSNKIEYELLTSLSFSI